MNVALILFLFIFSTIATTTASTVENLQQYGPHGEKVTITYNSQRQIESEKTLYIDGSVKLRSFAYDKHGRNSQVEISRYDVQGIRRQKIVYIKNGEKMVSATRHDYRPFCSSFDLTNSKCNKLFEETQQLYPFENKISTSIESMPSGVIINPLWQESVKTLSLINGDLAMPCPSCTDQIIVPDIKTNQAVDSYILSNLQNENNIQQKYRSTYSKFLKRAADAYHISYPLLACTIYTETKFISNIGNSVDGAVGIAQIMPATFNTYNQAIGVVDRRKIYEDRLLKHYEKLLDDPKLTFAAGYTKSDERYLLSLLKVNENYVEIFEEWENYWGDDKQKFIKNNSNNVTDPQRAVGMAGMILKDIDLSYRTLLAGLPINPMDKELMLASAYNRGKGGAMRLLQRCADSKEDFTKCFYRQLANECSSSRCNSNSCENCIYVNRVRNCMMPVNVKSHDFNANERCGCQK